MLTAQLQLGLPVDEYPAAQTSEHVFPEQDHEEPPAGSATLLQPHELARAGSWSASASAKKARIW